MVENWYYIDIKDYYEDDNNGYIYGLEWEDENENPIDCMWFKTEYERESFVLRNFG